MASPKTLRLPGELGVTTVETPYTVRSLELVDLLNGVDTIFMQKILNDGRDKMGGGTCRDWS